MAPLLKSTGMSSTTIFLINSPSSDWWLNCRLIVLTLLLRHALLSCWSRHSFGGQLWSKSGWVEEGSFKSCSDDKFKPWQWQQRSPYRLLWEKYGDEIRASLYTSIDVIRVCAMSCGYGETVYISPTLDIIDKITEAIQKVQKRRRRQRWPPSCQI